MPSTAEGGSSKPRAKSVGHYIIGKTLGEGTFGKVKLGTHILTGEHVAVKVLEKERIVEVADAERAAREVHILKLARHPHIIQLYEIIETRRQLYLIMEYACGGELFDYIVANKRVAEPEAARFFHQIIAGVEKIHSVLVVHRDLKPENLLLDKHKNIKIVDFGLSNTYREGQLLKTACGSPCYASPEMIAGHRYVPSASDLWSCGVILFALVCGYLPFEDQQTAQLYQKILAANYQTPRFVSASVRDLIAGLLTTEPRRRFTVSDVRAHPWYRQIPEASIRPRDLAPGQQPDEDVLNELEALGFPRDYAARCLELNKHNQVTTTYWLLAEKKRRMLENLGQFSFGAGFMRGRDSGVGSDSYDVALAESSAPEGHSPRAQRDVDPVSARAHDPYAPFDFPDSNAGVGDTGALSGGYPQSVPSWSGRQVDTTSPPRYTAPSHPPSPMVPASGQTSPRYSPNHATQPRQPLPVDSTYPVGPASTSGGNTPPRQPSPRAAPSSREQRQVSEHQSRHSPVTSPRAPVETQSHHTPRESSRTYTPQETRPQAQPAQPAQSSQPAQPAQPAQSSQPAHGEDLPLPSPSHRTPPSNSGAQSARTERSTGSAPVRDERLAPRQVPAATTAPRTDSRSDLTSPRRAEGGGSRSSIVTPRRTSPDGVGSRTSIQTPRRSAESTGSRSAIMTPRRTGAVAGPPLAAAAAKVSAALGACSLVSAVTANPRGATSSTVSSRLPASARDYTKPTASNVRRTDVAPQSARARVGAGSSMSTAASAATPSATRPLTSPLSARSPGRTGVGTSPMASIRPNSGEARPEVSASRSTRAGAPSTVASMATARRTGLTTGQAPGTPIPTPRGLRSR